jgi:hypothetical protein
MGITAPAVLDFDFPLPLNGQYAHNSKNFTSSFPRRRESKGADFKKQDWGCAHGFPPSRE